MRSEQEMLELILNSAKGDDRVRAVIMTGSRANPNARRDIFQDFDIVYLVTDVDSSRSIPPARCDELLTGLNPTHGTAGG